MFDIQTYKKNKGKTFVNEQYDRKGVLCGINTEQELLILGYSDNFDDAWTRDEMEQSDQVDADYLFKEKLITFNYINYGILQG